MEEVLEHVYVIEGLNAELEHELKLLPALDSYTEESFDIFEAAGTFGSKVVENINKLIKLIRKALHEFFSSLASYFNSEIEEVSNIKEEGFKLSRIGDSFARVDDVDAGNLENVKKIPVVKGILANIEIINDLDIFTILNFFNSKNNWSLVMHASSVLDDKLNEPVFNNKAVNAVHRLSIDILDHFKVEHNSNVISLYNITGPGIQVLARRGNGDVVRQMLSTNNICKGINLTTDGVIEAKREMLTIMKATKSDGKAVDRVMKEIAGRVMRDGVLFSKNRDKNLLFDEEEVFKHREEVLDLTRLITRLMSVYAKDRIRAYHIVKTILKFGVEK